MKRIRKRRKTLKTPVVKAKFEIKASLNDLFRLANLVVLPFWLLMLLLPRTGLTRRVMNSNLIFSLLGAGYTTVLVQGLRQNPSGFKALSNPDLDGITKLFASKQSVFAGWVHFLTFDLFVGRWIYMDSLERGKPARLSLLLTFLAGPLGLLFYLNFARPKARPSSEVKAA